MRFTNHSALEHNGYIQVFMLILTKLTDFNRVAAWAFTTNLDLGRLLTMFAPCETE